VLLTVGLAACGSGGDSSSTSDATPTTAAPSTTTEPPFVQPAPVSGMLATIEVSRLFSLDRSLALGLQNVGPTPVTVVQIQLETPLFDTVPLADEVVPLFPGSRELVMPVPYGPARCAGDPADEFAARVVFDDGTELRLEAPERNAGGIGRLHDRECAAAAVLEQVDLRFGDDWTRDGRAVTGELVLEQRRPGPTAAVEEMTGTVIFGLAAEGGSPILEVADEQTRATVPVVVSAERCDPHALIEAKKAFVFVAWVRLGDDEAVPIEVEPAGPARAALDELLASCLD
jgi:hypothetical protein